MCSALSSPSSRRERGEALLETLLFLPLALFFLFGITDAALFFIARGALHDALRRAASASALHTASEELLLSHAPTAAAQINEALRQSLSDIPLLNEDQLQSSVQLLQFNVHPTTGALDSYRRIAAAGTPMEFPETLIRQLQSMPAHPFASPLGLQYHAEEPEERRLVYAPYAYLIYLTVEGPAPGLNTGLVQTLLGRSIRLNEMELRPVRFMR